MDIEKKTNIKNTIVAAIITVVLINHMIGMGPCENKTAQRLFIYENNLLVRISLF